VIHNLTLSVRKIVRLVALNKRNEGEIIELIGTVET